jgi:hypothetical protein
VLLFRGYFPAELSVECFHIVGSTPGGKTRFLVGVKNRLMPLELAVSVLPALEKVKNLTSPWTAEMYRFVCSRRNRSYYDISEEPARLNRDVALRALCRILYFLRFVSG